MATKFKTMTPTQRREARVQARMNKSKPPAPIFSDTSRGRRAAAEKAAMEVKPSGFQPNQSDRVIAEATAVKTDFEDIFLSIIQFLPPEEQGRAFSLFSVFRKSDPADQKAVVDSLMEVAQEQTGPLFKLYKDRIQQDTTYKKADLSRQLNNAKAIYDRVAETVDLNALREKAKTDKTMAKTIRSITNTAFVDRALGGVQRRRSREVIDEAGDAKDEINVKANQLKTDALQNFGRIEQDIQAKLAREDVLQGRDLFDQDQDQLEAERGLFLSLFENSLANSGENARDNIGSGDIDVSGSNPSANLRSTDRADVLAGGTDAQRRARGAEEIRVKNAATEQESMNKGNDLIGKTVQRVQDLWSYRKLLQTAGKDATAVSAEIDRLMPIVQREYEYALAGKTRRAFHPEVAQQNKLEEIFNNNVTESWLKNGIQPNYSGINTAARDKAIVDNAWLDQTFGKDFLEVADVPFVNKYGATEFDTSKAITPAPRQDLLSDVSGGSVYNYKPPAGVMIPAAPGTSKTPQKVASQPYTVTNPNTGQQFTGAAAQRLAKRLAAK